jgi:hypothetical protein
MDARTPEMRNPCEAHRMVKTNDFCPICLINERDEYMAEVRHLRKALEKLIDWGVNASGVCPCPKDCKWHGDDSAECKICYLDWALAEAKK